MRTFYKKLVLGFLLPFCILTGLSKITSAQCTLDKGDIAFTGYDLMDDGSSGTTNNDRFSFVLLKDIPANQEIYFTDLGWTSSNAFQPDNMAVSDGIIKWTSAVSMLAGTEVQISCKFSPSASVGTITLIQESYRTRVTWTGLPDEYMSLGDLGGDQLFAFTGTPATPSFLAGASINHDIDGSGSSVSGWDASLSAGTFAAERSVLPAVLASGAQNVSIVQHNDATDVEWNTALTARYNIANGVSGVASTILAKLNTPANWSIVSDGSEFTPFLAGASYAITIPVITAQPVSRTNLCAGTPTTFSVTALYACSYKWQVSTDGGTNYTTIANGGVYTNAATATLSISSVTGLNGNKYRVIVYGNTSPVTSSAVDLTLVPALVLDATAPANATYNAAYTTSVVASGGKAPYTYSVSAGTVPAGLTLNTSTGVLAGTPTAAGTYNYTIAVLDACGTTITQAYTLVVNKAAQTITFSTLPGKTYGDSDFAAGATASSGLTPAYTSSDLAVATISGTNIQVVGVGTSTITASNAGNANYLAATDVTQTLTIGQKSLTVVLAGTVSKMFDGTNTATLAAANYSLPGLVGSDAVTLNNPTAGTYDNANVGTGKTVTVSGLAISGANSANYLLSSASASGAVGTIVPSNNADLANLSISAGNLSPAFASATTAYTASVENSVTSVTLTPLIQQANANVTVNGVTVTSGNASGAIALNVGANTITTTVTAQDGSTTKTYTITVSRAAATTVLSIVKASADPSNAASVDYTVTFGSNVSGLSASNFGLTTTGISGASVASVSGSGSSYTVAVNTGTGDGTIQLKMNDDTGLSPALTNVPFTGATYSIDKTAPLISSVSVPANGTYKVGQNLDLTINLAENVVVTTAGGTPRIPLVLNTGGTVYASYISGSGTSALTFRYTVASGNLDLDGISIGGTIQANGGTIKDASLNNANLTLNSVGSAAAVLVDGIAPAVSSITRVNAAITNAASVDYTLTFSENITGLDVSDLSLSSTGTAAGSIASVSSVSGSVYTVTVNSLSGDGTIRLDLNNSGTGITDAAGNAIAAGFTGGQVYTLDHTTALITSVNVPANATYTSGENLDFTVNFNEAAIVNTTGGTPRLGFTLNTGGLVYASYLSGSGTSALTFRYTVSTGNQDLDGISIASASTLGLNGGTVADVAGNNINNTLNSIGSTAGVKVDALAPTLSSIAIASNNATSAKAKTGDVITLSFTASEPIQSPAVTIAGRTASVLNISGNNWTATQTMQVTDAEGLVAFNISFSDAANNAGTDVAATSNASSVTFDRTAPAIPGGLAAVQGNTQQTINWSANAESDLSSYILYAGTSANPSTILATITAGTNTYTNTGLVNGITYYYRIAAKDQTGNISSPSADITATPKADQTITFNASGSATYGDADFDAGATSDNNTIAITYSSSNPAIATIVANKVHIVKAGTVTITASQAGNASFNAATSKQQTLTIAKKAITVSAAAKNKTYGDADPVLTYSISSGALVVSDAFTGSLSRTAGENAGTYAINQNTLALSDDYTLTYNSADLAIAKKAISVTANSQNKTYGDADPSLTYAITSGSLVGTDAFSGSLSRTTGEDFGTYAIGQNNLALSSNYTLTYSGANLSIAKKAITVTADAKSKTYGAADPALTYAITAGALVGTDTFNGSLSRVVGETAGTYAINQGSLALNTNYSLTYNGSNLTIGKKILTVTASNQAKTYDAAAYSGGNGVTYSGFTGADNSTVLGGTLTYAGTSQGAKNAGTYVITPQGYTSNDYTIIYVDGSLTIGKAALTVTASSQTKTYDAAAYSGGNGVTYSSFAGSDDQSVLGGSLSYAGTSQAAKNAGSYLITPQGYTSGNYTIAYVNGNLQINKAPLSIIAVSKTKIYDALPYSGGNGVTYNGFVGSENTADLSGNLAYTGTSQGAKNAGTYLITPGGFTSDNYSITYQNGNLVINKGSLAITAESKTKVYGSANPLLSVSYSGQASTEANISLSALPVLSTVATASSPVGNYPIVVSGASSDNYQISYVNGALEVTKAVLTATADNKTKFQGTENPAITISYSGFVNGDNVSAMSVLPTASTSVTLISGIGSYPINVSGGSAANYSFNYVPGTFTVSPAAPTGITFNAIALFENRNPATGAGSFSSASDDPGATFTYSLVSGAGDTDNGLFRITQGQVFTKESLDYENKKAYSIRVRSTTQHGFFLEKVFTVNLSDVNEKPTIDQVNNQKLCYTRDLQIIVLSGITPGPESNQKVSFTVTAAKPELFESLSINPNGVLTYRIAAGQNGASLITITVKDNGGIANGGEDTYSCNFNVTVRPLPVVMITSDKGLTISKGETVNLVASGGASYTWNNGGGIIGGQNTNTLTIRPSQTGTYRVSVVSAEGCVSEKEITITVKEDYQVVTGTNILTPNGDGKNDNWVVRNIDMYPGNEVKVFDRAGRLLYSKKNYQNEWDGTLNGSPLAEGTYYYIVDFGPGKLTLRGFITIIKD